MTNSVRGVENGLKIATSEIKVYCVVVITLKLSIAFRFYAFT